MPFTTDARHTDAAVFHQVATFSAFTGSSAAVSSS
jgi:hypothetical protein